MSYGVAGALQAAVYARLASDPALGSVVGTAVFDAVPPGPLPEIYVTLGAEDVRDRSDKTGAGAEHRLIVSVVADQPGFQEAKSAAAAVSDALLAALPPLERGRIVALTFRRARARRVGPAGTRRIDLTFHVRVEDDEIS